MDITIYQNNRNPHKFLEVKKENNMYWIRQSIITFNSSWRRFICNHITNGFVGTWNEYSFQNDFGSDYHYYKFADKIERIIKNEDNNNRRDSI